MAVALPGEFPSLRLYVAGTREVSQRSKTLVIANPPLRVVKNLVPVHRWGKGKEESSTRVTSIFLPHIYSDVKGVRGKCVRLYR